MKTDIVIECLTCRTPVNGKGPAVQPRRLRRVGEDGRPEDFRRWHRARKHEIRIRAEVSE